MSNTSSPSNTLKKGLSIFEKHCDDAVRIDPLFEPAKRGNYSAAASLIGNLWTEDKTEELRQLILPERPPIFFSVPSTSRTNQLPIAYARFLAQKAQEISGCGTYLVGDEHISSLHTSMMKSLKKHNRLMAPRLYETFNPDFFDNLKYHAQHNQIMLVEDIITTGSSVNAFRRFLEAHNVPVECIISIKGKTQLNPLESDLKKLERTAKKAELDKIGVDWIALGRELTQSEVTTLSSHHIGQRYKQADKQSKLLMRRQLYYLYALKVCQRTEVATKLNKLSYILNRKEEKSHA